MSPRLTVIVALSLLLVVGCKDREITSYRAPKDPPPAMPGGAANATPNPPVGDPAAPNQMMANTPVPTATGAELTWTAPSHWTAKPASAMRRGSFSIKGDGGEADLSITAFPGSTGGLLANVNRWRGQLGLAPLADADVAANTTLLDAGELHLTVVDFVGTSSGKPTRIIGAIIPHGTDTWFFKLMGPDSLVATEKPAFLEFLRTIKSR